MSRIGKQPIAVPNGVDVKIGTDVVEVKGPKGSISTPVCSLLKYELTDGHVVITRQEESRQSRAQHGLRRTLLANCIEGVTKGFSKSLEVIGVGYRVAVKGNMVEMALGFSHPVIMELPEGIKASVDGQVLTLSGVDKELVGETAARIRRLRKPEPYKGKGIKYTTETIRRKVGKSGGKK
ncbi:50S ribosomal protein L6 [uncultured Desulfovibrio sp.]|uniref:50S ribosomal protein L6 n=1 Tax=uncultured Desulfovibrio sp. TaxID=167968 RepID=UPI002614EB01|nr:50S ribosomal protein L6 [uncultured Desulfovibrio sp.]